MNENNKKINRKDKYQYLLDLADYYIKKRQELMELQDKQWSEWRQDTINKLDEKIETILSDYERLSHEYEKRRRI